MIIRRALALLCLFLAFADPAPARAQSALAAQVAKPVSLPDIVRARVPCPSMEQIDSAFSRGPIA